MDVVKDIPTCRSAVLAMRGGGSRVGLVPTMGSLHEGHLSLIREARTRCDAVAVTIFVNPTQFGPNDDFDAYPRRLKADLERCEQEAVDLVFAPEIATMYPAGVDTSVHVGRIAKGLCGRSRPGHFDGVATVVTKLFNILPASAAFFGEKDYQQLLVIKRLVRDLDVPIEIVGCPIVREPCGLAMSSRNVYLTPAQREQATLLSRALFDARDRVAAGTVEAAPLVEGIRHTIHKGGQADIDYVEVVDAETLEPLPVIDKSARICLAVKIGQCRLIDNVGVDVAACAG